MEEGEYRGGRLEGESRGREKRVESEMKEKERVRESIVCLCVYTYRCYAVTRIGVE